MPLPSTSSCLTGRPDACIIMSRSPRRQLGAPLACDWTRVIPENKKETDEGSLPAHRSERHFFLAGARSIPSLLALSARRLQAQCVLLLYVVCVCAVNMRWRSQGWCDGEEQSVPAHPCPPPRHPLSRRCGKTQSVIVCMAHFEWFNYLL